MTGRAAGADPFGLLGLPASREVTDDDVRAAWRRTAVATHPDRADGGDPERFMLASAAYTALRTRYGRGEVLADLAGGGVTAVRAAPGGAATASAADGAPAAAAPAPGGGAPGTDAGAGPPPETTAAAVRAAPWDGAETLPAGVRRRGTRPGRLLWRIRHGRPAVLAVRVAITAAASALAVAAIGFAPSALALITGAVTWLALTARHDLAPPGPG